MMCLLKESWKFFGEVTVQEEKQTHAFRVLCSLAVFWKGSVLINSHIVGAPA